ncbi:diguanylate cyclase/phosphodiesterase [Kineococcus radiotolerans SRS30216 = ATCC BAA-149]|uniref:Diguanylate cyclase/phosphodiesterase n=1 Tax=Kineococcus radiotolerans (strain ATCC BAA-149 / DSM 14245 / SRS30216) TaxID=266940 RepID=A6W4U2_KINRD|nr:diguanylate cyclase/phosphodiesterase [Kineococcus radiotolerans SRS30216 = ATCC BAA-149]
MSLQLDFWHPFASDSDGVTFPPRRRATGALLLTGAGVAGLLSPWALPTYVVLLGGLLVALAARPLVRPEGRRVWGAFGAGAAALAGTQLVLLLSSGQADVTAAALVEHRELALLALLAYPVLYGGQMGLLRRRVRELLPSAWLDGVLTLIALAAAGCAFLVGPVVAATGVGRAAALALVARPALDLLLLSVALATCGILGRRSGARTVLLAAAFGVLTVADTAGVARLCGVLDAPWTGAAVDAGRLTALALVAVAAWSREEEGVAGDVTTGWTSMLTPLVVLTTSCTLLAVDHVHRLPSPTVPLALLGLAGVGAKAAVVFREVLRLADSRRLALTDDLTGLPNRRALAEALRRTTTQDVPATLLLLDLDGFKEVNDTHGHAWGDRLLRLAAERVQPLVPPGGLLARVGGDEFALLLPGDVPAGDTAARVGAALGEPALVGSRWTSTGSSTGVATWPFTDHDPRTDPGTDPAGELLRRADAAMYVAKRAGGGWASYDDDQDRAARAQRVLAEELASGIAAGQLTAHYQPQVDVRSGRTVGLEALVRWEHPRRGTLAPGAFLDLAESHGLMAEVTGTVLRRAARDAARWHRQGHRLRISVNLATSCLLNPALPLLVEQVLDETGLDPAALVLEITETTLMAEPARSRETIEDLLRLGTSVSIDDYGTGYSSLAYLQDLPAAELKLDRAFTVRLTGDPRTAAIIASTADLAHSLGLRMLVEGVEDAETLRRLAELGVDETQGYHHAQPMPAADVPGWLAAQVPVPAGARGPRAATLGR